MEWNRNQQGTGSAGTSGRERRRAGARYQAREDRPGLGFVRRRDVEDRDSQVRAPSGPGHYDRSGEDHYEEGLHRFEEDFGPATDSARVDPGPGVNWELDEGGVQFGRPRGEHAGRGPRGYRRSDERIREDVCDLLTEASDIDATDIEVTVSEGIVTLGGFVSSRGVKRRAEDVAAMAPGVHDVENRLRVGARGETGAGTT